jgi:hypothetical protein
MNCKQCQQNILESLAGRGLLAPEVSAHQKSCAACREFFGAQQTLFLAIDTNLHSLANQPVPSSLLPSVRARLDEGSAPNRARFFAWSAVAVTAATLVTVNLGYHLRQPVNSAKSAPVTSIASRSVDNPQPDLPSNQAPRKSYVSAPKIWHSAPTPSTPAPEVIVLAEERQAFARFVAEVPEKPEVAKALVRPAPGENQGENAEPVEIAVLQIDNLNVKPLEGTAAE